MKTKWDIHFLTSRERLSYSDGVRARETQEKGSKLNKTPNSLLATTQKNDKTDTYRWTSVACVFLLFCILHQKIQSRFSTNGVKTNGTWNGIIGTLQREVG